MRGERRRAELEAQHHAANAPNRRRCLIEGCPEYRVWQVTSSREESLAAWRRHYMEHHYVAPTATQRPARPARKPPTNPLGSPPTTARHTPPPRPSRSTWDERTESTWIDKL